MEASQVNSVIESGACYGCDGSATLADMMEISMWAQYAHLVDTSIDVTRQALDAESSCLACYGTGSLVENRMLALLNKISVALE